MYTIQDNAKEIQAAFEKVAGRLKKTAPLMRNISEILRFVADEAFRRGRSPAGVPWQPLSATTIHARARQGYGPRPILIRSGRLANSIVTRWDATKAMAGTNAIQAAVLQFGARKGAFGRTQTGTPIPWGDIPARPFLGFSRDAREDILEAIRSHVMRR